MAEGVLQRASTEQGIVRWAYVVNCSWGALTISFCGLIAESGGSQFGSAIPSSRAISPRSANLDKAGWPMEDGLARNKQPLAKLTV